MEKEFLTVYYLKHISEGQHQYISLKNLIPIRYEEQLENFIKKINRIPHEIEIINWLVENRLYKEVFKLLIPADSTELMVAENEINKQINPEKTQKTKEFGELNEFYLNFRCNKQKYTHYEAFNDNLKINVEHHTTNIQELKKFILLNNIFKRINTKQDTYRFLKNKEVIKVVGYINKKENIYVAELPIFKHRGFTLSVETKGFTSHEKFIEMVEENNNIEYVVYSFDIENSFYGENIFFIRFAKFNRERISPNSELKASEVAQSHEFSNDLIKNINKTINTKIDVFEDKIEQSADTSVSEITTIETPEKTQARRILNYYKENMFELNADVNSSIYLYHPEKGVYFEFNNDNDILLVRDNVWSEISQWTKEYYETERLIKEIIEEEKWFNVAFELKPACLKRENGYWKDIEYNFIFKYQNPEKITEEYLKNNGDYQKIMNTISSNYNKKSQIENTLKELITKNFVKNETETETESTPAPVSENELPEYKINVEIDFDHMTDSEKFEFDVQMKQIQNIFSVKNLEYKIIKQ